MLGCPEQHFSPPLVLRGRIEVGPCLERAAASETAPNPSPPPGYQGRGKDAFFLSTPPHGGVSTLGSNRKYTRASSGIVASAMTDTATHDTAAKAVQD